MTTINLDALTYWQLAKLHMAINWEIFSRYWVIWLLLALIAGLVVFFGYVLGSIGPYRR